MAANEFSALLSSPAAVDDLAGDGPRAIVLGGSLPEVPPSVPPLLPVVVVADVDEVEHPALAWVDLVATGADLEAALGVIDSAPTASSSLAVLLRESETRTVADGLLAESAVYGVLQAGPEFARWRSRHPVRPRVPLEAPAVRCAREGDVLRIALARPQIRNALDAEMRDALAAALHVAACDPSLRVELSGDGPSFCSGGHLDEFGTRSDPADAHRIRLARSLGWLLHGMADRTRVVVQGACRGSGVELPAFAGTVVARPGADFGLPELGMGLIPGAGGTVSLPRRIGRHRTAWLALTGRPVDAATAHRWGLVDEVAS